jgi:hypothetical protein
MEEVVVYEEALLVGKKEAASLMERQLSGGAECWTLDKRLTKLAHGVHAGCSSGNKAIIGRKRLSGGEDDGNSGQRRAKEMQQYFSGQDQDQGAD